jgi:hypothetical protein
MSIYQFTTKGKFLGQANENVYCLYHPTMTAALLEDWITEFVDLWNTHMQPVVSNQWSADLYSLRRIDAPGYPEVVATFPVGLSGNGVGDVQASQMSVVATMRAGTTRPNRARKFFGGWNEGSMTGGLWTTTVVQAVELFVGNLLNLNQDPPSTLPQWVTVRWLGPTPGNPTQERYAILPHMLETYAVSNNPSALHSRRIGVGA